MKAIQLIRPFLPGVIFSFALMATSLEVSAQNCRNNYKSNRNNDREEYRNERSNSSEHDEDRNDDEDGGNKKHYKKYKSDRNNENYEYNQHYSQRPNCSQRSYSNHPQYGRVHESFDQEPVIFRNSHGDYYYSDNQFYTYRDGIGYCEVEPPREVYFTDLPFDCNRVYVNGHTFFRNGDLYFSHSPRGYVIVPPPLAINFSIRF